MSAFLSFIITLPLISPAVTDTVSLSPSLVIQNQSIGVATTAQGFQGVDGILGIGPVDLTQGTVSNTSAVPTVTDNLFAQGSIPQNSIGIFYQPTTEEGANNGELSFGSVDSNKLVTLRASLFYSLTP